MVLRCRLAKLDRNAPNAKRALSRPRRRKRQRHTRSGKSGLSRDYSLPWPDFAPSLAWL